MIDFISDDLSQKSVNNKSERSFKTHRRSSYNNINDPALKKSHSNKFYNSFLDSAYDAIVHCKKALFLLPTETLGKTFIEEMTRLGKLFNP